MNLVYQPDGRGCFAACCATLFGGTYEEWECVGHHHHDWRDRLFEKTGCDYVEVKVDCFFFLPQHENQIYILGVDIKKDGKGHVVLGRSHDPVEGELMKVNIFHDPAGEVSGPYRVDSVILLVRRFS